MFNPRACTCTEDLSVVSWVMSGGLLWRSLSVASAIHHSSSLLRREVLVRLRGLVSRRAPHPPAPPRRRPRRGLRRHDRRAIQWTLEMCYMQA